MFKKVTASVLALLMVFGAGATSNFSEITDTSIKTNAVGTGQSSNEGYFSEGYLYELNYCSKKQTERYEKDGIYDIYEIDTYDAMISKLKKINYGYAESKKIIDGEEVTAVTYICGERSGDFIYLDLEDSIYILAYVGNDKNILLPKEINGKYVAGILMGSYGELYFDKNGKNVGGFGDGGMGFIFAPDFKLYSSDYTIDSVYIPMNYFLGSEWIVHNAAGHEATIECHKNSQTEKYLKETDLEYKLLDFEYSELDDGTIEITRYSGSDAELVIPSEIHGKKVTSIGSDAFFSSGLLTNVTIPDSVTRIRDSAFFRCTKLENITIPESVTEFGYNPFEDTAWIANKRNENPLVIVNNVLIDGTTIKDSVVNIPDNVTAICGLAFYECDNLTSVNIPDGVTSIGVSAFGECPNIKSITIPASVKEIGDAAIGYYYNPHFGRTKVEGFKVYCYKGTAGHEYALTNGFDYELLDAEEIPDVKGSLTIADNDKIYMKTVKVTIFGDNGKVYEATISDDGTYSIDTLPDGDYTLTVSADGYVSRDYEIKKNGSPLELDVKLCRPGDITADGKVDITDVTTAIASVRGVKKLDEYETKVGNVADSDEKLDITDVTRLISHVRGKSKLY